MHWDPNPISATIAANAIPVLLDAGMKSVLVLVVAAGIIRAMSKSSAAARHLVWFLAVASLPLLPLLSWMLPGWHILPQWLSVRTERIVEPSQPPAPRDVSPPPASGETIVSFAPGLSEPSDRTTVRTEPAEIRPLAAAPKSPPDPRLRSGNFLWLAWTVGAGLAVLPIVLGFLSLWHLERSSRRETALSWVDLLRMLLERLRSRRKVALLKTGRRRMPMTWGIFRPRLLLPEESETWASDRRRVVMLHELAHVQRWDCLTNLITQLICALYWFNPLVWWAAKQMVAERERACDDVVLRHGAAPADYAEQILQIAAQAPNERFASGAIAMARPSKLESRLRAILDGKRNRAALTASLALAAVALFVMVVLPVAVMKAAVAQGAGVQGAVAQGAVTPTAGPGRSDNLTPRTIESEVLVSSPPAAAAPTVATNAPERPFVVKGRVTDEAGEGVAGVTVYANCGAGTLFRTGETQTDAEGRYTLRFREGMSFRREDGTWGAGVQAATIIAQKTGFSETNLNRVGDLLMADHMPAPGENVGWKVDPAKVVLTNQPYELNFVMRPAASVRGRLLNEQGQPAARTKIWIEGDQLPPSSSVLAQTETDDAGGFSFEEIPTGYTWRLKAAGDWQIPMKFDSPVEHTLTLRFMSLRESRNSLGLPVVTKLLLSIHRKVTGTVIDAETRRPIENFTVTPGRQGASDYLQWNKSESSAGKSGAYQLEFDSLGGAWILVEAAGYASEMLRWRTNLNFELRKSDGLKGIVTDPNGNAVEGAQVAFGLRHSMVVLGNGTLRNRGFDLASSDPTNNHYSPIATTDRAGRFHLPTAAGRISVYAAHARGFAEVPIAEVERSGAIQLKSWARIEGTLRGPQPSSTNNFVEIELNNDTSAPGFVLDLVHAQAPVDVAGHFIFERVPAGDFRLYRGTRRYERSPGTMDRYSGVPPKRGMVRPSAIKTAAGATARVDLDAVSETEALRLNPNAFPPAPPDIGFQVHLHAPPVAELGDGTPRLLADIVNHGPSELVCTTNYYHWQLEVDGVWYVADGRRGRGPNGTVIQEGGPLFYIVQGQPWTNRPLVLNAEWRTAHSNELGVAKFGGGGYVIPSDFRPQPLKLSAGRHIVRLAVVGEAKFASWFEFRHFGGPVRTVSTPIAIDVTPPQPYGSMSAPPGEIILKGRVVDAETLEPIRDFLLQRAEFAVPKLHWHGSAVSDPQTPGRFRERHPLGRPARILAAGYEPQKLPDEWTARQLSSEVEVRLKRGPTLRGSVVDHTGRPVKGARVYLSTLQQVLLQDGEFSDDYKYYKGGFTTTDDAGHFELRGSGADPERIVVVTSGGLVWQAAQSAPGQDIPVTLPRPESLTVRYDIPGDAPEAKASLLHQTGDGAYARRLTVTNRGQIVVTNLAPGTYVFTRSKNSGHFHFETIEWQKFVLEAGQTQSVDMVRTNGQPVRGRIVGIDQDQASRTLVIVVRNEPGQPVRREINETIYHPNQWAVDVPQVGADGSFETALLNPGTYNVMVAVYKEGFPTESVGVSSESRVLAGNASVTVTDWTASPVTIEVRPPFSASVSPPPPAASPQAAPRSERLPTNNFVFISPGPPPGHVILKGQVVDDVSGERVKDFVVQTGEQGPPKTNEIVWTGASWGSQNTRGSLYEMLRPGKPARILAAGYQPQLLPDEWTRNPPASEVEVRLKRGAEIRGTVLDDTGRPVSGARVYLATEQQMQLDDGQPQGGSFRGGSTTTDNAGRFELRGSGGPAQRLVIVSSDGRYVWPAVLSEPGEDVRITLPRPGTLAVRYDIPGDMAEVKADLYLEAQNSIWSHRSLMITNRGQAALTSLAPGTYHFTRHKSVAKGAPTELSLGAPIEQQTVVIESGQTRWVHMVRTNGQPVRGRILGLDATQAARTYLHVSPGDVSGTTNSTNPQWICNLDGRPAADVLQVAADGTFETVLLTPGTYTVIAHVYPPKDASKAANTLNTPLYPWNPDLVGAATVTVTDQSATPVAIPLVPAPPWPR